MAASSGSLDRRIAWAHHPERLPHEQTVGMGRGIRNGERVEGTHTGQMTGPLYRIVSPVSYNP